jgi:hypothetical protein
MLRACSEAETCPCSEVEQRKGLERGLSSHVAGAQNTNCREFASSHQQNDFLWLQFLSRIHLLEANPLSETARTFPGPQFLPWENGRILGWEGRIDVFSHFEEGKQKFREDK